LKNGDEPINESDESDESDESSEESSGEEDPQTANIPFKKETSEDRLVRLNISRMIFNGKSLENIKWKYPNYYAKEKAVIGLEHMFHANHAGSDHPFFCGRFIRRRCWRKIMI
jgi:hypothetical protein